MLWALSFAGNLYHDEILLNIRHKAIAKGKTKELDSSKEGQKMACQLYDMIPHGGLYTLISFPNYLCEWVKWFSFALMASPIPDFALLMSANSLLPTHAEMDATSGTAHFLKHMAFKGTGRHSQHALRRSCLNIFMPSLTWVTRPLPHQGQLMNSFSQVNHSWVAPFLGPRTTFFQSSVVTLHCISMLTTPQITWSSSAWAALTMVSL
jgi:3-oxo-5-alpha-steroid 4-dehydrogenase/Insulinase (Peptidase family M16)